MNPSLFKIIKLSAKVAFDNLRNESPLFCKAINKEVKVTKLFFSHLYTNNKTRGTEEIVKRLSMIILLKDVIRFGGLINKRGSKTAIFYEICYVFPEITLSVILLEKLNGEVLLYSCFDKYKKNLSDPPMGYQAS